MHLKVDTLTHMYTHTHTHPRTLPHTHTHRFPGMAMMGAPPMAGYPPFQPPPAARGGPLGLGLDASEGRHTYTHVHTHTHTPTHTPPHTHTPLSRDGDDGWPPDGRLSAFSTSTRCSRWTS